MKNMTGNADTQKKILKTCAKFFLVKDIYFHPLWAFAGLMAHFYNRGNPKVPRSDALAGPPPPVIVLHYRGCN